MKISLNWLKKYVKIDVSDEDLIKLIGARLVEVEGVIDENAKYNNIYIVQVKSCEKIPDTHLTLCQIDVGIKDVAGVEKSDSGLVQVVCGAPNVREGMLAVWIAPGAIVPASVHEDAPFVIGKRKMRGYESNGMLAGADELDFGDDYSGIVEIDPATASAGDLLADVFELKDLILEIENKSLTHRPDCFGLIGLAREVAGILGVRFNEPDFSSSELDFLKTPYAGQLPLSVDIADSSICSRYTAIVLEKHGEIKKKYLTWQDTILSKSGMRPIDPIVDATNYLMLLTGQPLHAFDYDKFVAVSGASRPRIVVRLAREGEKLILLDGKDVVLQCNDIVITSNDVPVALAGAMGGASTEIDENTHKIILESATFSLYNLRKTQMAHGIFSEAITRFTKGQPACQTMMVAEKCAEMLSGGFKIVGGVDEYPEPEKRNVVKVTVFEINVLLGTKYSKDLIIKTLENVGFEIKTIERTRQKEQEKLSAKNNDGINKNDSELEIVVPAWRTDIHIKEDVIEEVGRLLGYENIVPTLPSHGTAVKNEMLELKTSTRDILKSYGANELLTYSFVSERLLTLAKQDAKNSYRIINSISPELQYVRQSIVPSLLEKAYLNQKLPVDNFALFEMNKVYQKEWGMDKEGVPVERTNLGFVVAERKTSGTAFYKAKMFVERYLAENNILAKFVPLKEKSAWAEPFEPKRSAEILVDDECIGVVGEFKNSVRHNFKLAEYLAGFELDLEKVLKYARSHRDIKISKEHESRDITIKTHSTYGEVVEAVEKILAEEKLVAKITPIAIYQPKDVKHISLHLEFDTKINEEIMHKLESFTK
ncbi:phenylalanine--tRNA ligase subunit beta [Candidatus Saccharibacteria bacterium]|nr:phenylalanine--tRNA ligase subunit beta [Candidatus Saccharibacteria bacterium]